MQKEVNNIAKVLKGELSYAEELKERIDAKNDWKASNSNRAVQKEVKAVPKVEKTNAYS